MRLATALVDGAAQVAAVVGDRLHPLPATGRGWPQTMAELAAEPGVLAEIVAWLAQEPAGLPLDGAPLLAPVPRPPAVYTIGENYRTASTTGARREEPLVFGKQPSSVIGPGQAIPWSPDAHPLLDYEAELGVVIGRHARNVAEAAAMEHVFGYTCVNDVASRHERFAGDQWLLGKSGDGFCPLGPWIVTADELSVARLAVQCVVAGELLQDGSTEQMIFTVPEIVAHLSRHATLLPGTVIATGTPAGVGESRTPPRYLVAGNLVTVRIEGIGELTNPVTAVPG